MLVHLIINLIKSVGVWSTQNIIVIFYQINFYIGWFSMLSAIAIDYIS